MSDERPAQKTDPDLVELSHKTGLVIRPVDSVALNRLFTELERYDEGERAETFDCLKNALNETRRSLGAELTYQDQ
ncbi:MAG: hypothetical protein ACREA9_26040 [Pyrinomonadaceae bacterium]